MSLFTTTMPTTEAVPSASAGVRRITVDEYERIIAAGALNEPDRVELIDGYMVVKMGRSAEHGFATKKAIKTLEARLQPGWSWRSEQPVRIPDYDEPEPDVTIVRGTDEDYEHRIPVPADVGLLIEVSLSTLDQDRGKKLSSYAACAIPVYWIINLAERQVEVYSRPEQNVYRLRVDYRSGQSVPIVIDGHEIGQVPVDQILPSQQSRQNARTETNHADP